MAHIGQSRPDSSLGFQVKVFQTLWVVFALLDRGMPNVTASLSNLSAQSWQDFVVTREDNACSSTVLHVRLVEGLETC